MTEVCLLDGLDATNLKNACWKIEVVHLDCWRAPLMLEHKGLMDYRGALKKHG
jgi:hypothetical protein